MRQSLTKLEQASGLDRLSDRLQQGVRAVLRSQRVRDVLHGVWLGHPLHPAIVQLPLGAWTSAAVLDLLPGQHRSATTLVAVGTASALPAALAGANDWAELTPEQRRVGLVHAVTNIVGTTLYLGSLVARLTGRQRLGRTLGFLGLASAGGGGYLGGHLAYKQAAQVNQAVPEMHRLSGGWRPIADVDMLPQAQLVAREIDSVALVVYRDGDNITVMLERCAHQSGPLSAGRITQVDGHACVVCPWHGSTFQLDDGAVVHGPSGTDQQVLPTRVVDGVLEIRLP